MHTVHTLPKKNMYLATNFRLIGSGRHWISHLIEMATGIQSKRSPYSDGGIVILDHFLLNHGDNANEITDQGIVMYQYKTFDVDIRLFHQYT